LSVKLLALIEGDKSAELLARTFVPEVGRSLFAAGDSLLMICPPARGQVSSE